MLRPNHRASDYTEKYKDTCRTDKRKLDEREPSFGVGLLHACMSKHNESSVSAARQARDVSDTVDLIHYLNERDPFVQNDSLFNIANGTTAQERVNVEKASLIGVKIVESMAGKSTDEFTFRKANQAVTLGSRSTVKIKGEHVNVYPQLLFRRLLTIRERCDDVTSLFQYERCTNPTALFELPSLPLQPQIRNTC